ncbi:peptidase S8 [Halalkalibacillus sediminis]|uniref:Peptidase S8 n=1 Tax=Halalkalibacillus sediminis TaxID=2018042 RepID=A0A2I0QWQ1_9BACI|nr:S8 family serine peptidase [Halalkalibacillus sediminis]PKR78762.1 peptidase S8 [Halalkalibacillus sediminis]
MYKRFSKPFIFLMALALILSSFSMSAFGESKPQAKEGLKTAEIFGDLELASDAPTSVIVELQEESIVEAKHKGKQQTKAKLKLERGKVISDLKSKSENAKVNREYDYVFSGFSVELPANEITKLATIEGVKAVYPNVEYKVDAVSSEVIDPDAYYPEMMHSAPYIGADDAWDAGFTGEGITVAVIDTGVDYTHPDLAHAFGDYKGWDLVDNDDDPQETQVGNPAGGSTAHGTHVSGTIAAKGDTVTGIAPDAKLLAYRVLGPGGSGTTENVVAGIERAVQDGADVMNLSLGNTLNNPDWATSIALDWAMAEGVVAVTSNGNSGPDNWTVGSPGTSREAISVGATQLPYDRYETSISTSGDVTYSSAELMGYSFKENVEALDGETLEYVDAGIGTVEDMENLDLDGKVALISRGAIAFVEKATNAKAKGAVGAIIYNHVEGDIPFEIPGMALPTIKLSDSDGAKILAELAEGNNEVTFDINFSETLPEIMADFSSRGPVTDTWMIKPDVSAPGVNITSTIPTHDPANPHGYAAYQGTSMSAPHVAGTAALILEANPTWGVDEVKASLMNTSVDLIDPATGESYPHNSQGAGSIRILDAINTDTLAVPGSHSFGKFIKDSGKQVEKQSFELKNLSDKEVLYSFDVKFEGNPKGIKVTTSKNLNVNAGESEDVNLKVQVDTSKLDPGYYEGSIEISDGKQIVDVPTILFVGEPDYPRVTGAYFANVGEEYVVGSYLPAGAEVLAYDVYVFNANGTIGDFIGTIGEFTNVPAPIHEFSWDGSVDGTGELPNGDYVLGVYVESNGVSEYKAYLVTKD